ncbi:TRAP transporter substrate-binding protein [Fluviibacterium sp. DFM31]|uniref:TRAP transporter substrate-binding protein n=1 Tax=Meridianimarinicoccus marinus TaxID=3231483 RepID=A0ABV3LBE5_9RHOB
MKHAYRGLMIAAASALAMGAGTAGAETTLKMSHFVPTAIGLHTDFMEPWARDLEACSNGEVTVEIHPAGSALGNITKQFDQVRAGVTDISFGHTGIPRGRFPRTSLIELPFVAKSANASSFALWNLSGTLLKPEYPGVHMLGMMAHNPGVIHTTKPVNDLSDLAGLRIRTPNPAISEVLKHYGAEPIGLPPGQIYENLQKGTLDGLTIDWTGIGAYKLGEVVSYHYDIPLYTVGFFFAMNQRTYDGLPENVRACVDKLSGDELVARFGPWWDEWGAAAFAEESASADDVIVVATPEHLEAAKAELAGVTEALIQEVSDSGVKNAAEILEALIATSAEYD